MNFFCLEHLDQANRAPLFRTNAQDMILTSQFLTITLWAGAFVTTKYFYISTVERQISWLTNNNSHDSDVGSQVFSVMLPLSGLFCILTGQENGIFGML